MSIITTGSMRGCVVALQAGHLQLATLSRAVSLPHREQNGFFLCQASIDLACATILTATNLLTHHLTAISKFAEILVFSLNSKIRDMVEGAQEYLITFSLGNELWAT